MTKGAVYYNFGSKEDILDEIILSKAKKEKRITDVVERIEKMDCNGLRKVQEILKEILRFFNEESIMNIAAIIYRSPRMIGERYISNSKASVYISNFVKEGIEDGSIKTKYPDEIANFIIQFCSLDIGLHVDKLDKETFIRKIDFFKEMLGYLGIDTSDEVRDEILEIYDKTHKK